MSGVPVGCVTISCNTTHYTVNLLLGGVIFPRLTVNFLVSVLIFQTQIPVRLSVLTFEVK